MIGFPQDYLSHIETLPETDTPELLGLSSNIERSAQKIKGKEVIGQLKVLMRASKDAGHFDKEHWSKQLGPVLSLWKKLNHGTDLIGLKLQPPSDKVSSPVEAFVCLERYNAVRIVQVGPACCT